MFSYIEEYYVSTDVTKLLLCDLSVFVTYAGNELYHFSEILHQECEIFLFEFCDIIQHACSHCLAKL